MLAQNMSDTLLLLGTLARGVIWWRWRIATNTPNTIFACCKAKHESYFFCFASLARARRSSLIRAYPLLRISAPLVPIEPAEFVLGDGFGER